MKKQVKKSSQQKTETTENELRTSSKHEMDVLKVLCIGKLPVHHLL